MMLSAPLFALSAPVGLTLTFSCPPSGWGNETKSIQEKTVHSGITCGYLGKDVESFFVMVYK